MIKSIEIYEVSNDNGIPGFGATVHYQHGKVDFMESYYFPGERPSENEVRKLFLCRLAGIA